MTTILELDDRRRASLGKIGRKQDTRYRVTERADGTIILDPVVDMTKSEIDALGGVS